MAAGGKVGVLRWDVAGAAARVLAVDATRAPGTRTVRGAVYALVDPTPLETPLRLLAASESALKLLDVSADVASKDDAFIAAVTGNERLPGSEPYAHAYAGHQFGSFAGQLGDGRAISLGEVVNGRGERWELQLKGAGLTPFSRHADGRAVLRSSIREFLCSEHMHALGIPTTRAATLVQSASKAVRDPMYDGHPIEEPCAVVLRLAPTFFRFGSFEIFKPAPSPDERAGPSVGLEKPLARQMLDWLVSTHFPHLTPKDPSPEALAARDRAFFREVTERTARMVAEWQLVGFTHGVLNTDNMSVLGLTIDYGPFGFLDMYEPRFIPNTTDQGGRYRFEAQPQICMWNLARFAEALSAAGIPVDQSKADLAEVYMPTYEAHYVARLRPKLGLTATDEGQADMELFGDLFDTMEHTGADMTNTFRLLSRVTPSSIEPVLDTLLDQCATVKELARSRRPRHPRRQLEALRRLQEQDPSTFAVLMQGSTAGAPEDAVREGAEMIALELERWQEHDALLAQAPEAKRASDRARWAPWLQRYADRIGRELGSTGDAAARAAAMNRVNPKFILRNYLAQRAIADATAGDLGELQRLFTVLTAPYDEHTELASAYGYDRKRPESACDFMLSCSS